MASRCSRFALAILLSVFCQVVMAQAYPSRPVRIIAAYPPGGSVDMVARLVGEKLRESLGQTFIIENRAGASGNIGTEYVAKSPPDGYTLLMGSSAAMASNVHVYAKLAFDPIKDFESIIVVAHQPNVLVVPPSLGVRTVAELIALAKSKPGKLNYASSGSGTSNHMAAEMFMMKTGTNIMQVPFKGGAPALSALLGGQVDLMFETVPTLVSLVKAGKLRALAVTSTQRLGAMPDVPTMAEAGLKEFDFRGWIGLSAPAGTPRDVVAKLNAGVQRAMTGDLKSKLAELGLDAVGGTPEQFSAFLRDDIARYDALVKASGMERQ
jgi:tripartite-type tricarboxylate transporter receptor subunit TctC